MCWIQPPAPIVCTSLWSAQQFYGTSHLPGIIGLCSVCATIFGWINSSHITGYEEKDHTNGHQDRQTCVPLGLLLVEPSAELGIQREYPDLHHPQHAWRWQVTCWRECSNITSTDSLARQHISTCFQVNWTACTYVRTYIHTLLHGWMKSKFINKLFLSRITTWHISSVYTV